MRFDAQGLFWEDKPVERVRGSVSRSVPPIPQTGWKTPAHYPDLSAARCISFDTETYDPEMRDYGPGWARGVGHIVGFSVSTNDGYTAYFPIRHEVEPEYNLDPAHALAWLKDTLATPHIPKIGANLIYDIGWLQQEEIHVQGELYDVQYAEALLSENSQVALDVLGRKYLGQGKETNTLYDWCYAAYGGSKTDQRANIYRSPPQLVGPYAESDAYLPFKVYNLQHGLLHTEGLYDIFRMECELIPLLIQMRFAGIRVDIAQAEQLYDTLGSRLDIEQQKIDHFLGGRKAISAQTLAPVFDSLGIQYPRTAPSSKNPTGQPSFTKDFLATVDHPLCAAILEYRRIEKLRGTFIKSYIIDSSVNGRVYGQFHQLRSDAEGTRSGRFSSSTPNLQNIPSRDEELAPLIRGMFLPDEGDLCFYRSDFSQIEYRFLAHFAIGPGSDEVRALFMEHPETDYHEMTLDMVAPYAGWDVTAPSRRKAHRKPVKTINFGLVYGMGQPKLCRSLNLTKTQGSELFKAYHSAVPFTKLTLQAAAHEAASLGVITTILGRKSRFDYWEPDTKSGGIPLLYADAVSAYGAYGIRRAHTHKALNRRLQGSAADAFKKGLWLCYKDGIFDTIGYPKLLVHDEICFSQRDASKQTLEGFAAFKHTMENAIPLRVPLILDCESGPDWGHCK